MFIASDFANALSRFNTLPGNLAALYSP